MGSSFPAVATNTWEDSMASPNAGTNSRDGARDGAEIIAFPGRPAAGVPPPGRSDGGRPDVVRTDSGRTDIGRAGASRQSGALELARCAARLTAYRNSAASTPDPDCDAAWYHAAAILEEETWRKQ
jgi:hypothetical protein